MYVGRISHPDNLPSHKKAIAPKEKMFTLTGMQDIPVPKAIQTKDIPTIIDEYRHAASLAIEAGADGVEIHGVNVYLIHCMCRKRSVFTRY